MILETKDILNRLNSILIEDDLRDRFSKFMSSNPSIKLTSELKSKNQFNTKKSIKVFKKSKITIFFSLILVLMLWLGLLLGISRQENYNGTIAFLGYCFAWFITILILWQFFYSDEYNYTMYIDNEGIQIDSTLFKWEDIEATAILHYPGKGEGTNKLVILTKDNYWKYDLLNFYSFSGIAKTVSNYIEFYKKNHAQQEVLCKLG